MDHSRSRPPGLTHDKQPIFRQFWSKPAWRRVGGKTSKQLHLETRYSSAVAVEGLVGLYRPHQLVAHLQQVRIKFTRPSNSSFMSKQLSCRKDFAVYKKIIQIIKFWKKKFFILNFSLSLKSNIFLNRESCVPSVIEWASHSVRVLGIYLLILTRSYCNKKKL